jgi:DNA-binding NarL/FixJ family response regulator
MDIQVVGEAANGADAVALAARLRPDVVVMDVTMPVMDGIQATHELRTIVPESSVVILSLHDDVATRDRARLAGAASFIAKHQADHLLLAAIRQAATTGLDAGRHHGGRIP